MAVFHATSAMEEELYHACPYCDGKIGFISGYWQCSRCGQPVIHNHSVLGGCWKPKHRKSTPVWTNPELNKPVRERYLDGTVLYGEHEKDENYKF